MSVMKKGDLVFVFDASDIVARCEYGRTLPSGVSFPYSMDEYCGKEYIVSWVEQGRDGYDRFHLEGIPNWVFTKEMIGPVEETELFSSDELQLSFDDVMEL